MKIIVTPFTMPHYDAVITLWQNIEGVGLSSADERNNIATYLDRNPGMSFVAVDRKLIVGAALCGHDGRRGFIHHLAVHPDYRRQGIGTQLVDHCLTALQTVGIQKCHLFIFHLNSNGRSFWEALGWEWREDIAVMSRKLTL